LVEADGFDEHQVGFAPKAFGRLWVAGDYDDVRLCQLCVHANLTQDVYSLCARQVQIQQHQIRHYNSQPCEGCVPGSDDFGLKPDRLQHFGKEDRLVFVVLNNQRKLSAHVDPSCIGTGGGMQMNTLRHRLTCQLDFSTQVLIAKVLLLPRSAASIVLLCAKVKSAHAKRPQPLQAGAAVSASVTAQQRPPGAWGRLARAGRAERVFHYYLLTITELLTGTKVTCGIQVLVGQFPIDHPCSSYPAAPFAQLTTAAPIILAAGEPVMALGGFSSGDHILTTDELAEQVTGGVVRFFLIPPQAGGQAELTRWVVSRCTPVPSELWQSAPPGTGAASKAEVEETCGDLLSRT
jgi:hypothetical protein